MGTYSEKAAVATSNMAELAKADALGTGLVAGIADNGDMIQVYWEVYKPSLGDCFLDGDKAGNLSYFPIAFGQIKPSRRLMCEVPSYGGTIAIIGNGRHTSTVADIYTRDLEFSELSKYKWQERDPQLLLTVASRWGTVTALRSCMGALGKTYNAKKDVTIKTLYEYNVILSDPGLGYCISDYCDKPFLVPLRGTAEEIYKAYISTLLMTPMQGAAVAVKCIPRDGKSVIITSIK